MNGGGYKKEIGYQFINLTVKNNAIPFEPSNYTLKYVYQLDATEQMSSQLKETEKLRGMKRTIKYKNVFKDWGMVKIYSNRTIHLKGELKNWNIISSWTRDQNKKIIKDTKITSHHAFVQLGDEIVCQSSEKPLPKAN